MNNIDSEEWTNILPKREINYFQDWHNLENLLGEFGQSGFINVPRLMTFQSVSPNPIIFTFTIYRGADGLLLGVFINYMADGILKPFGIYTHPDHQRLGIGTLLADFVVQKYEEENNKTFSYSKSWGDAITTESGAALANAYVYAKINRATE